MSIYLATTSDYLSRNSGLLSVTGAHTIMVWLRNRTSVATTKNTAYAALDAHPFTTDQAGLFTNTSQDSEFHAERSGGFFDTVTSSLVTSGWLHLCYSASGGTSNNIKFYVNGTQIGTTSTFDFTAFSKALEVLGNNGFDTVADHDFAYFRAWTAQLPTNQIQAEMISETAVRTLNLWMDTPLVDDLLDDSGNGRNWTSNGSPAFTANSPFPDNGGYVNATDIPFLPYDISNVSADQNGVVFPLWYKWTATFNGAIGVYPTGSTNYEPYIEVFTLIAGVLTAYPQPTAITGSPNCPVQIGVETGTTYYIKVNPNNGTNVPSLLTLNVMAGPNQSVPLGSILIIDDTDNYPTAIISAINGDDYNVLKFIQPGLAFSEGGDILPNRVLFVADLAESALKLYDNSLALLDTISYTKSTGTQQTYIKANRTTNFFWVGDRNLTNPPKISKYDSEGALVTSFNLSASGLVAFSPNLDDTIIYVGTSTGIVKQWSVAGAAYIADLVSAISGYSIADMLVVSDGTLLVYYTKNSNPGELFVKRYDDTGTLLNTYTLENSSFNRVSTAHYLSSALDDPNSFWVWSHRYGTSNYEMLGIFRNVKISDGTILATIQQVEYIQGSYTLLADLPPLARFGNSPSCPFIILREGVTPPEGTATLTIIKHTVPSPDTTNTNFRINVGGGLSPTFQVMQDGDSYVYTEVPAGIYSVAEIVPPSWAVTYAVDNGDSPAEIHIADGDNVTVTITNTRGTGGGGGGGADNSLSGIYKIVPEKRNETLWESFDPMRKRLTKIPDPYVQSGLLGE